MNTVTLPGRHLIAVLVLGLLAIGWGVPLGAVLAMGMSGGALLDPRILRILFATVALSLGVGAIAVTVGLPLGLILGRKWARGQWLIVQSAWLLPVTLPSWLVAVGWIGWFGASGWLAALGLRTHTPYGWWGVGLAQVAWAIPWVAVSVGRSRAAMPERWIEAAMTLGAQGTQITRDILLPWVRAAAIHAVTQVVIWSATSYGIVVILGGGPPVRTLETAIVESVRLEGAWDGKWASAAGLWQALWIGMVALVGFRLGREPLASVRSPSARPKKPSRQGVSGFGVAALGLMPLGPVLLGLKNGRKVLAQPDLWHEGLVSLWTSLEIATVSVALALGVATLLVLAAESSKARRALLVVGTAPAAFSGMTLALGAWRVLGNRPWLLPGVQALLFVPIAVRVLLAISDSRSIPLWEVASTLGASYGQAWRALEWPRWRGALAALAVLLGLTSVGELSAASFLTLGTRVPLAVRITEWMGQYRIEEAEAFLAAWLLVVLVGMAIVGGRREVWRAARE